MRGGMLVDPSLERRQQYVSCVPMSGRTVVGRVIRPEGKGNQEDRKQEEVSRNAFG